MKAIVMQKTPYGVSEYKNVVSVDSGEQYKPISDVVKITYQASDGVSVITQTFNVADVLVQVIM